MKPTYILITQVNLLKIIFSSAKFPIYWSTRNLTTFLSEAVGTEPVSPHYESFVRSRRYLVCK